MFFSVPFPILNRYFVNQLLFLAHMFWVNRILHTLSHIYDFSKVASVTCALVPHVTTGRTCLKSPPNNVTRVCHPHMTLQDLCNGRVTQNTPFPKPTQIHPTSCPTIKVVMLTGNYTIHRTHTILISPARFDSLISRSNSY
jgi:hypothetical protein